MAKRKAESVAISQSTTKKIKQNLLDSDDSSSEDESVGGVQLEEEEPEPAFKINKEFATRFEHNKKREELQKLEDKYNKPTKRADGKLYGDKYDEDSESSDDEDEDDDGFLATEDLDAEISATLQALQSKDPRVYDEKVTFYKPVEEDVEDAAPDAKKDKPMYLRDYHRENLLKGANGEDIEEDSAPRTFAQEQADLQRSIVKEIHAAGDDSEDEDGGFMIPKPKRKSEPQDFALPVHPSRTKRVKVDVESADKDPETFLSNFLQARAWVPTDGARFQPLESDDEEEDLRADKFEEAYNLRFEKTEGANETLKSYARDIIAAKSVRREEPNSRKKQRDAERAKKEVEKAERESERARLRQLKIAEMEEKLHKIKRAAGLKGKKVKDEDWAKFLDEGWDDATWEAEMNKKFGQDYYAEGEEDSGSEAESGKKKKLHKPKWDDDIDINDIIPDFIDEEEAQNKPAFALSDSEDQDDDDDEANSDATPKKKSKTSKDHAKDKAAKKKAARLERKKIEELVDNQLDVTMSLSKTPATFRYRETSPMSFGLNARDILMAPDKALNEFAGLKKMAAFRDPEKKRKDKKNLSKKARIRQWRKDTFGDENGPTIVIKEGGLAKNTGDIVEGKKKKRSKKNKKSGEMEV
ncbi:hypothetical protein HYALB_00013452 [Hymenoscyphus albidus]|uniref:Kri1-like C-terminal domain-containing protein n=1 Tax=Hymenoscyphus albidus TaxID=595503 RepID=A0A9N9LS11_9HELO|nr:hypothetical protein HYALB_00013452 [Hymenoscyphus albidus]